MVFSSDRNYTIRPAAGTQLTLDLAGARSRSRSWVARPLPRRRARFRHAGGGRLPATLALALGSPAKLARYAGRREETTPQTGSVISTAGNAALSVATGAQRPPVTWSTARSLWRAALAASASSRRGPHRPPMRRSRSSSRRPERGRGTAYGHLLQDADRSPSHNVAVGSSAGCGSISAPGPIASHSSHPQTPRHSGHEGDRKDVVQRDVRCVGTGGDRLGGSATAEGGGRSGATGLGGGAGARRCRTCVNGMAQAGLPPRARTTSTTSLWVETNADTDFDGKKDRVHVNISRRRNRQRHSPVIFEDSPYYAGIGGSANWAVDHELGIQRRAWRSRPSPRRTR